MPQQDSPTVAAFGGLAVALFCIVSMALGLAAGRSMPRGSPAASSTPEVREITCVILDIHHFTTLSTCVSPQEYAQLLDRYLRLMTQVLRGHGGAVEKYVGDMIVAVFDGPSDAERACVAGSKCILEFDTLRRGWEESGAAWYKQLVASRLQPRLQIGLTRGRAARATLGDPELARAEHFGDVLGLAHRLRGATKVFGTTMLASESVLFEARAGLDVREIERMTIAGKLEPITIFEVIGLRGSTSETKRKVVQAYHEGIALCRDGDLAAARSKFQEALSLDPADGPSRYYLELIASRDSGAPAWH